MKNVAVNVRETLCGAIFIALGAFFAIQSLGLQIGSAFRMGPGYFPLVLACILILLGIVIIIQGISEENEPIGPIALRGTLFILPAMAVFGATVRGLGFVPALFLTAVVAAFASRKMRPHVAFIIAIGLTVFSIGVFSYGLGLPFRLVGPWLGR